MTSFKKSASASRKPHIVFVYYYFPPMGGGGVQRIVKWLKYWDYHRFQVSVLTVKESYFYATDASLLEEIPFQRVQVLRSGSWDVFRAMRFLRRNNTPTPSALPTESHDRLRRLASWIAIPDSRAGWLLPALIKLWHLHRDHPIDLVLASMPPFTAGVIAMLFNRWQGVPYIVDYRDAWLTNPYIPKRPPLIQHLHARLEASVLKAASGAIFVNPHLENLVLDAHPDIAVPRMVIRNGFDPQDFLQLPAPEPHSPLTIGIMGSIYSQGNRPLMLLTAIQELIQEMPQWRARLRVQFIGKWSPGFLARVKKFPYPEMIQWQSYLPHQQALQIAARCHVMALSIEEEYPGNTAVTPGRLYEYLALGRPILAMVPPASDVATVLKKIGKGIVIPPADKHQLKKHLRAWIQQPPSVIPPKWETLKEFSRPHQTQELLQFLQQIL